MQKIWIFLAALSLVACAARPAREHLLLQAQPPTAWQQQGVSQQTIGIGPITLANYLSRTNVTLQNADGSLWSPVSLRWAEPLDAGIARVLGLNLAGQSPNTGFVTFPWRKDQAPEYSVRLDLHNLSRQDNQLWLTASWSVWHKGKPVTQQHFHQGAELNSDHQAPARALNQLLWQLAQSIRPWLIQESH